MPQPPGRRFPSWLIPAIGYAVSIACMVMVYRDFHWDEEWPRIRAVPWHWIAGSCAADIAVYCVQGWRWNMLLSPLGQVPIWRTMQAIYIGLFANEVLPLRPGEILRTFLQARWSGVPISVVLSSAVVERLFDGVWLILGFYLASLFVELPKLLVIGSHILLVVLLILSGLLAFAVFQRDRAERWLRRTIWAQGLHHLIEAIHRMSRSPSFHRSFLLSVAYLLLQIGPIYFLQRGFGLTMSIFECAVLLVILRIGGIPPQGPGNVGTFQGLVVLGAMLFGVDRQSATGYATLLFLVVTVPLWIVGFFCLLATGMKLSQLRSQADAAPAASPHADTPTPPLRG